MRSIKEIFVIGIGPSSSHTMGPNNVCKYLLETYKDITYIKIILYGSLAKTGKGHLTDYVIDLRLKDIPHEIIFNTKKQFPNPNTLETFVTTKDKVIHNDKFVSIGGGTIIKNNEKLTEVKQTYPHNNMNEILAYCKDNNLSLLQYIEKYEDKDIRDYMRTILDKMIDVALKGMQNPGEYLPGDLKLKRKAHDMYLKYTSLSKQEQIDNLEMLMTMLAIATSEENAAGGEIVCAPTCGSAGVVPGAISYLYNCHVDEETTIDSLMVGALIGIVCKQNGSISGAEAGCQAEIGVACAIASALLANADGLSNEAIVNAAEIALEHSLGLTCDPIEGRVQIPCIERNALFALKARDAFLLAKLISPEYSKISLDEAIATMVETGKDINPGYRETSKKGLAKLFARKNSIKK